MTKMVAVKGDGAVGEWDARLADANPAGWYGVILYGWRYLSIRDRRSRVVEVRRAADGTDAGGGWRRCG